MASIVALALAFSAASNWLFGGESNKDQSANSEHVASAFIIGDTVRLGFPFYGCRDKDDLRKITALQREHDVEAMEKAAYAGKCAEMERGQQATVMQHSAWSSATCIRRRGEPDCDWVPDAVLENNTAAD